ncbi:hypothetical protein EPN90_03645 [Patescibacteria group bacterium]|nr:MAG: hypothetical protein EPN90_03645 [Patescibacteria group bacterium]
MDAEQRRAALLDFFDSHLLEPKPERAAALLEPFVRMIEDGRYYLSARSKFRASQVTAILALATDGAIQKGELVSLSAPPLREGWMTEEAAAKSFGVALAVSTCSLELPRLALEPPRGGGELPLEDEVTDFLEATLWKDLRPCLVNTLCAELGEHQRLSRWVSDTWDALFLVLLAARQNRTDVFLRLKPLIELLSHAILAGRKRDDSSTAILFVA